jgi:hypothetical protein
VAASFLFTLLWLSFLDYYWTLKESAVSWKEEARLGFNEAFISRPSHFECASFLMTPQRLYFIKIEKASLRFLSLSLI